MTNQTLSENVCKISELVSLMVQDDVDSRTSFRKWIDAANPELLRRTLGYRRRDGMDGIAEIIEAHFHPLLPLIMLSYTERASRTLGLWRGAWSPALKICRGIIFDRHGNLVALPLPKFFNHDEPSCGKIPDQTFTATEMYDGRLGIVFHFDGAWRMATRDGFGGPDVKAGRQMLRGKLRNRGWKSLEQELCLLTEIVHPETAGYINYDWQDVMLIGITDRNRLEDMRFRKIDKIARSLRMPFAHVWPGDDLSELSRLVNRPDVRNREGYVARFAGGKRIKFKFRGYVCAVAENNLSYIGLMSQMMTGASGGLAKDLPEEVHDTSSAMIEELAAARKIKEEKARCAYLHTLPPSDQCDADYKKQCEEFAHWVTDNL